MDTGAVNENADRPMLPRDLSSSGDNCISISDIDRHELRRAAFPLDLTSHLRSLRRHVDNYNGAAISCQPDGRGTPDPGRSTGNDRDRSP
jgi:hypothetical protein